MTRIPINIPELVQLVYRGYSNDQLAEHFHCNTRTIERRRIADPALNATIKTARRGIAAAHASIHGTTRRYSSGCRCRPCTDANTERCRVYGPSTRERRRGVPRCGRDVTPPRPTPIKTFPLETLIAQAIARGEATSYIMRRLAVTYEAVAAVRDELDEAAGIWPTRTETEETAA